MATELENAPVADQGQQEDVIDFVAAKVRKLPGLACIGYVDQVGEVKSTGKEIYMNIPITVKGTGGSRGARINFLFRPDWFVPGFDPESLNDILDEDPEDGKPIGPKMYSQYRKFVKAQDGADPAILRGLCGSEEGYRNFLRKWNRLYKSVLETRGAVDGGGNPTTLTSEEVRDLFNDFFVNDNSGVTFGYELKQGSEKTGQTDENGKVIYRDTDRYELAIVRWYDEATDKAWERRAISAAKAAERQGPAAVPSFRIGFSQE